MLPKVAAFVLVVAQLVAQVSSLPAHAQPSPAPLDPKDTPAGALGAGIGSALDAVAEVRQQAVLRQRSILELRSQVAQCGDCPEAAALRQQLSRAEAEDREIAEAAGRTILFGGGTAAHHRFVERLTDPLNIRQQARAAEAQARERVIFRQNLTINYCYAATADTAAEQACRQQFPLSAFDLDAARTYRECAAVPDIAPCIDATSLVPRMKRDIAAACRMPLQKVTWPALDVITQCAHPSRSPPSQGVRSSVTPFNTAAAGGSSVYGGRDIGINTASILMTLERTGLFRTITCTYSIPGSRQGHGVEFWHDTAPAGFGLMVSHVRKIAPDIVGMGIFSLGGAAITACPASHEEATKLKQDFLAVADPAYMGSVLPASAPEVATQQHLLQPVRKHTVYRARNHVSHLLDWDTEASKRLEHLVNAIYGRGEAPKLFKCTYAPAIIDRINLHPRHPKDSTFAVVATFYYWHESAPQGWEEIHEIYAKSRREVRQRFDALMQLPLESQRNAGVSADFPPVDYGTRDRISRQARRDCPETLEVALNQARMLGDEGPLMY